MSRLSLLFMKLLKVCGVSILLLLAVVAVVFAAASIGTVPIPLEEVWTILLSSIGLADASQVASVSQVAILELRLPRILMSLLAGASLSMCGVVFQSIFRNPICDPYILGVSSGASIGAALAFVLGLDALIFGVTGMAFLSALLTLLFIFLVAGRQRTGTTQTILLTGVAVNFLISAILTLLMVLNQQEMQKIFFWTMGSLSNCQLSYIPHIALFFLVAVIVLLGYSKDLNLIQLGDKSAQTLGVNVRWVSIFLLVITSLIIAGIVSLCGVIGFIGLIIPNLARIIWGNDVRKLLVASLFLGAFFLLLADTLARVLSPFSELPVGSITALVGAPYFIFLLINDRKKQRF